MFVNLTLCLYEVDFLGEHSSDYTRHFETLILVNTVFTIFVNIFIHVYLYRTLFYYIFHFNY